MEPLPRIRVLVVDDSAVVRRLVTDVLADEPDIEVAGTAGDGRAGLERVAAISPDVVVLDVEMPVLDGLATLRELRQRHPRLPVIMFSTLTARGAAATLDALAAGANDYVTKPTHARVLGDALESVRSSLVPLIRTWGRIGASRQAAAASAAKSASRPAVAAPRARADAVEAVLIGSSTGGPNALSEVVPALPADLPVPVLVVQHMPTVFTKLLADRLDERSNLTVVETDGGMVVERGHVYVAQGGMHSVVRRRGPEVVVELDDSPPENSCKPAVDVLFRSAARVWGGSVLVVMLTGMGQDGLLGTGPLHAAGATVIVQDEASCVVWGMPGALAREGLAHEILPLDQIAAAITARVARQPAGTPA